jgi:hypothetical protein
MPARRTEPFGSYLYQKLWCLFIVPLEPFFNDKPSDKPQEHNG